MCGDLPPKTVHSGPDEAGFRRFVPLIMQNDRPEQLRAVFVTDRWPGSCSRRSAGSASGAAGPRLLRIAENGPPPAPGGT